MFDELIRRYAKPVPHYATYPTVPHFHTGVTSATYAEWLAELPPATPISLYGHVPFCGRRCWICACHAERPRDQGSIAAYLKALHREIETVANRLDGRGYVTTLHLGGGSPSVLNPRDLLALVARVRQHFVMAGDLEFGIEIDPNDMTEERYDTYADAGVTRISVGVHDFDHKVQTAINRLQSVEQTSTVINGMRARGVGSVNIDILYGLPHQTAESIETTVDLTLGLRPDRIALFGYAHVPWVRSNQKMIDEAALPGLAERYRLSQVAAARIRAAGYDAIGIDHFALPTDTLTRAARDGTLRRNSQGYTTDAAPALIGLGASAIGSLPQGHVQNVTSTAEYARSIAEAGLATARGIAFDADDRLRGWVIERLICDFAVSVAELVERFGGEADPVVQEMRYSALCDGDELVSFDGARFAVTERGKPFVRTIASTFDTYLAAGLGRHSVAV